MKWWVECRLYTKGNKELLKGYKKSNDMMKIVLISRENKVDEAKARVRNLYSATAELM